jgi:hypothetical protein
MPVRREWQMLSVSRLTRAGIAAALLVTLVAIMVFAPQLYYRLLTPLVQLRMAGWHYHDHPVAAAVWMCLSFAVYITIAVLSQKGRKG